jgi:hypothetical protein
MDNTAGSLLGLDLNLINAEDARTKIVKACVKCWFEKNDNHLYNMSDCSGFVKAVQRELFLEPFVGDANSIFDEVEQRSDWLVLGTGSGALADAGRAANQGFFTIGVWKNPTPKKRGHVAVVLSYLSLLGSKPEHHSIGAWGQYGKVGELFEQMSKSFGKDKHAEIRYAKCLTPVI